jgi:hypothetical protein
LQVLIPPEARISVSCECCVLYRKTALQLADPSSRVVPSMRVCVCVSMNVIRCNINPQYLQSELAEEVLIRKKIYLKVFISLDVSQLYALHITSQAIQSH